MADEIEISGEYNRSILFDLTRIVVPASFGIYFIITGTVVLIYVFYVHDAVPTNFTIGASITFGILTLLLLLGHFLLYYRRRHGYDYWDRRRHSGKEGEEMSWHKRVKKFCVDYEAPLLQNLDQFKERAMPGERNKLAEERKDLFKSQQPQSTAIELENLMKSEVSEGLNPTRSAHIKAPVDGNACLLDTRPSLGVQIEVSQTPSEARNLNPQNVEETVSESRGDRQTKRWSNHSNSELGGITRHQSQQSFDNSQHIGGSGEASCHKVTHIEGIETTQESNGSVHPSTSAVSSMAGTVSQQHPAAQQLSQRAPDFNFQGSLQILRRDSSRRSRQKIRPMLSRTSAGKPSRSQQTTRRQTEKTHHKETKEDPHLTKNQTTNPLSNQETLSHQVTTAVFQAEKPSIAPKIASPILLDAPKELPEKESNWPLSTTWQDIKESGRELSSLGKPSQTPEMSFSKEAETSNINLPDERIATWKEKEGQNEKDQSVTDPPIWSASHEQNTASKPTSSPPIHHPRPKPQKSTLFQHPLDPSKKLEAETKRSSFNTKIEENLRLLEARIDEPKRYLVGVKERREEVEKEYLKICASNLGSIPTNQPQNSDRNTKAPTSSKPHILTPPSSESSSSSPSRNLKHDIQRIYAHFGPDLISRQILLPLHLASKYWAYWCCLQRTEQLDYEDSRELWLYLVEDPENFMREFGIGVEVEKGLDWMIAEIGGMKDWDEEGGESGMEAV